MLIIKKSNHSKYLKILKFSLSISFLIMCNQLFSQNNFSELVDIQNKILDKNKEILNVSWRQRKHNSAYFDTSYSYKQIYYKSKNKDLYVSYINILPDTIFYNLFVGDSSRYIFVNKTRSNEYCNKEATIDYFKNYWREDLLPLSHPEAKKIIVDTAFYMYKIYHLKNKDSFTITHKEKDLTRTFVVDHNGRIRYFKAIFKFEIAQIPIVETIIYDLFVYKDSIIDVKPFFNLNKCQPLIINNKSAFEEFNLEDTFLNKRFTFNPLAKHLDSNKILNSGKITILEYSYLSCFGCALLLKSYDKILDSFSNEIDIIIIDPIDKPVQKPLIEKTLKQHQVLNRIEYLMAYNDAKTVTLGNKIQSYPILFFIDKHGIVRCIKDGVSMDENIYKTFKKEIERILKL